MSTQEWAVVIPVKGLQRAKSRLSTRLPADRGRLALAFALDVVAGALATPAVATVLVVSQDDTVRRAAAGLGAATTAEPPGTDLNAALSHGVAQLPDHGAGTPVALLAADLPALRPRDLQRALLAAAGHPRAFVSDVAGTGTTLLTAQPGVPPQPRFGARSRAEHASAGAHELTDSALVRLRCDVDTEVDLWHAVALGVGVHTEAAMSAAPQERRDPVELPVVRPDPAAST
jgi:2-phospho-L-lactate guanylyltransferase